MTAGREKGVYQLGLIGWPLGQSLSPALHTAALQAAGLSGDYRLFPVPVDEEGNAGLAHLLDQLRIGALQGLNVTIPHKQTVIPYLDELTPAASLIGAVNTIMRADNRLVGDNTDAPGFLADVKRLTLVTPGTALVLGAGGAARAVVYALLVDGWHVTVAARQRGRGQAMVADLALSLQAAQPPREPLYPTPQAVSLTADALRRVAPDCSLIVNCTPVGMATYQEGTPWPEDLPFPADAAVYDLVYNPGVTPLVQAARQAGRPAATGLGMLVEQAALAFERWTGQSADRKVMWAAVHHQR